MPRHAFDELAAAQRGDDPGHGRRRDGAGRRLLPALLVLLALAGLVVAAVFGWGWLRGNVWLGPATLEDYPGPGSGESIVEVTAGDTGSDIATTLVEAGVIKDEPAFVQEFAATPDAAGIQPGQYRLREEMSSAGALEALLHPENRYEITVTVPEGLWASEIFQVLSDASGIPVEEFEAAAANPDALGLPAAADGNLDGYLFPATYTFAEDATAADMLTAMIERNERARVLHGVAEEDWHEVLTKASIVQREARLPEDFSKVARVIENRLDGTGGASAPMPLQMDSTITYISGRKSFSTTPEERAVDSPYNTYLHPGLPKGPISAPGDAAIEAVLNPAEGDWIYFVTVDTDTGETVFSDNKADHDRAVQQWRDNAQQDG